MRPIHSIIFLLLAFVATSGCADQTHLEWNQEDGYRWAKVEPGTGAEVGFQRLDSSDTGISFINRLTDEEISESQPYLNGSGVAAGDVNGDGWTDLYFTGLHGPNRLYVNRGGFEFVEVTDSAGVAHEDHYSTGTVLADVDGDDDPDLLVGSISKGVSIYINDGTGRFAERSEQGFEAGKGNTTLALADVDGDRDLDLYVANYKEKSVKDLYSPEERRWENTTRKKGAGTGTKFELVPPFDDHYTLIEREGERATRRETGEKDALYMNQGDGTFKKVSDLRKRFFATDGTPQGLSLDWGLNASFQDINQDGHPDLYVNNDFWTPDRIWINQGNGRFRAIDSLAIRNTSFSSMTTDFADINRNGALDFFVTEMLSPVHTRRLRQVSAHDPFSTTKVGDRPQYNRNSLFLNRGDGTYAEISYFGGVEATEWTWATRFLDVDLDGYQDLLINTGFSYDIQDLDSQIQIGRKMLRTPGKERFLTEYPPLQLANKSFQNGQDLTFDEKSQQWGFSTQEDVSHGMATADLDRDGDLDLVLNRLNAAASVFENETAASRIAVQLSVRPPNSQGIGAKVSLQGGPGGPAPQQEEITAGGDYLSGSEPVVMFAADPKNSDHVLTVDWPDGTTSTVDSVQPNRIYDVQQPNPSKNVPPPDTSTSGPTPIFEDVSGKISHRHHESSYNDFRIQPLLPLKLSQQGPGISWVDFDGDGDEVLLIPSGRGGELSAYQKDEDGNFSSRTLGALTGTTLPDQTTILGWPTADGTELLVGRANYEPGDIEAPSVLHYSVQDGQVTQKKPISGILSTTGPLAIADYDDDGDLDLFVGGRFVPTQYPRDATSRLFKNRGDGFVQDESNSELLKSLGLVTGATFTDYDGDGDQDLLVSRAWDSLKLFVNEEGTFRDQTEEVGLSSYSGWWRGITTGDFNNDGRPDIVATNWGTNSPYQMDSGRPLKMYYEDFDGDRRLEIIESYFDPDVEGYVPRRNLPTFKSTPVPFQPKSNRQFASSSLAALLGRDPNTYLSNKEINTLRSMVFINDGESFSAQALPSKAQFSVAFHAGVLDYNGDGNEDLFLSQNFFEVRDHTPRHDAGRGLLLSGNGDGHFEAVSGQKSGLEVYGEQRGAATSDFNGDGKVDLAVTQNGFTTKLYENQVPKSGIVVRLEGPPGNRAAIGGSIRLVYPNGSKGPRRTVTAGSGYWSQNSFTQVLGYSQFPARIEVTWPGGQTSTVSVTKKTRRYQIVAPELGTP